MRDQKDSKQDQPSQPQPNRPSKDKKRRFDTLAGVDADEPQICRGLD